MTHDDVARWLHDYISAWRSYDPGAIGALFSDDAEYRYHPWEEPLRGREAIVADWLAHRDDPGTWSAEYRPWVVEGDRAVAIGASRYDDERGKRTYHNVFLIEFDPDGRCRDFREIYLIQLPT
jgi:ketosteroid isomerase-like protein